MVYAPVPSTSTLPDAIRYRAKYQGHEPAYLWVDGEDREVTVTFAQLEKATTRVAHLYGALAVGEGEQDVDEVVAVLGHADTVVHQTLVLGLTVANLVVRLLSSTLANNM